MERAGGRRCAQPGCRARAMRGAERCSAHRRRQGDERANDLALVPAEETEPAATMASWAATREGRRLLARELARVIAEAGRVGGLTEEIGALRAVQARLMDEEKDVRYLAEAIPRLVTAIVRALRAQHLLAGESAGDLMELMTRILNDMGLGE